MSLISGLKKAPHFRLAEDRIVFLTPGDEEGRIIYTPGNTVCPEKGLIKGHGTYVENGEIKSSLAGILQSVNKLVFMKPLKCRYNGNIGDVVIGRITEIQQNRWKVDVNSKVDGVLLLSSVNLPGGELRRRSVEDERMMRQYLSEGDVISAEVMKHYSDSALALHTRNLRYGKLSQGVMVSVPVGLVRRTKTHFYTICGASLIIGTNGYIWIYPTLTSNDNSGGFARNLDLNVDIASRRAITKIKCCIDILAESKIMIYDTSIIEAVKYIEESDHALSELLIPEVRYSIAVSTQHALERH